MNHIEIAVMPLKEDAMARAESKALSIIEEVRKELEAVYFDIDKAAPHPHGRMSREEYARVASKRALFWSLCSSRTPSHPSSDPWYVNMEPGKEQKFIKTARQDAADQYEAFVAKLVGKIGEVVSAELTGNHVWSFSILTITKPDGTIQKWHTQQIINISKLGKLFNQWPTRILKR